MGSDYHFMPFSLFFNSLHFGDDASDIFLSLLEHVQIDILWRSNLTKVMSYLYDFSRNGNLLQLDMHDLILSIFFDFVKCLLLKFLVSLDGTSHFLELFLLIIILIVTFNNASNLLCWTLLALIFLVILFLVILSLFFLLLWLDFLIINSSFLFLLLRLGLRFFLLFIRYLVGFFFIFNLLIIFLIFLIGFLFIFIFFKFFAIFFSFLR